MVSRKWSRLVGRLASWWSIGVEGGKEGGEEEVVGEEEDER